MDIKHGGSKVSDALQQTSAYSLILVVTLVKQVRVNTARSAATKEAMSPDFCGSPMGQVSVYDTPTATLPTHQTPINHNETALQRLAWDLCIAVPCLGLIALVFAIGTIHIAIVSIQTTNPRAREFMYDAFAFSTVLAGNVVVLAFIYNLTRAWVKGNGGYYNGSASFVTTSETPATSRPINIGFDDLGDNAEKPQAS